MATNINQPCPEKCLNGLQKHFKVVLVSGLSLCLLLFVALLSFIAWVYIRNPNFKDGFNDGYELDKEQELFIPTKDYLLSLNRQTDVHASVSSVQSGRLPSLNSHRSSVTHKDNQKDGDPSMQLFIVHAGMLSGGVCLDGSPPAYYLRQGKDVGSNRWIIHFNGGAWCFDEKACLERSHTSLGSSRHLPKSPPIIQGVNSADPQVNPDFYDWNLVWVVYCDGASFTGDRENPVDVDGELIYFRGKRALDVILDDLLFRGFDKAERVILTGSSAGSMTAMFQADYIASKFSPTTPIHVLSDAGFFIETATLGGKSIGMRFKGIHEMQNSTSGLNQNCVQALGVGNAWQCFLPEVSFKYINTPTFVLNAAYDVWALIYFMGINCKFPSVSYNRARRSIDQLLPILSTSDANDDELSMIKSKRDISGFEILPFFRHGSQTKNLINRHLSPAKQHALMIDSTEKVIQTSEDKKRQNNENKKSILADLESREEIEKPNVIDDEFATLLKSKAFAAETTRAHINSKLISRDFAARMRNNPTIDDSVKISKKIRPQKPINQELKSLTTTHNNKSEKIITPLSHAKLVTNKTMQNADASIDRNKAREYHKLIPKSTIKNKRSMSIAREYISILRSDPPECTDSDMVDVMKYREAMIHATRAVSTSPKSGIFLVSCIDHSLSLFDETWTSIIVNGKTIAQAFGDWYYARPTGHHDLDCPYPCNPSCP